LLQELFSILPAFTEGPVLENAEFLRRLTEIWEQRLRKQGAKSPGKVSG
jgi:hypothetical protein